MMTVGNLVMDKQGKVLLNGEPIVEWYKKRNLAPCIMAYFRLETCPRACITGAMGYAQVEDKMSYEEFERTLDEGEQNPIAIVSELLGIDYETLHAVESGYMFKENNIGPKSLGCAARRELQAAFGTLHPVGSI